MKNEIKKCFLLYIRRKRSKKKGELFDVFIIHISIEKLGDFTFLSRSIHIKFGLEIREYAICLLKHINVAIGCFVKLLEKEKKNPLGLENCMQ